LSLTALYVAVNEEARIAESIRSVKAYADRVVVVDCVFEGNPTPGTHSSDRQREAAELGAHGVALKYHQSDVRMAEHEARNLAWSYVPMGEWAIILDADEILYGDHVTIGPLLAEPPEDLALRVYTTAVLFKGTALTMDAETYGRNPLINTSGYQAKVVRHTQGLETRRTVAPGGAARYDDIFRDGHYLTGRKVETPFVINHHVRSDHAKYQNTYLWEMAQGGSA
jgi:hypothetical protein